MGNTATVKKKNSQITIIGENSSGKVTKIQLNS
jgi:hypothetical protein